MAKTKLTPFKGSNTRRNAVDSGMDTKMKAPKVGKGILKTPKTTLKAVRPTKIKQPKP
jgi:hypothetical protein